MKCFPMDLFLLLTQNIDFGYLFELPQMNQNKSSDPLRTKKIETHNLVLRKNEKKNISIVHLNLVILHISV